MAYWTDNEEVKILQEYLRIPSVHPNVNYEPCVDFLKRQADSLGLPVTIYYPSGDDTKPVVLLTWLGSDPKLPSILLNSHMDVVPVFPERWSHPPFSAHIDEQGRIFARGTQDMKSIGAQYMAAVRALKARGIQQLRRTVHLLFVPDEETGGVLGMNKFVQTSEFVALNVGFALDEGVASDTEEYSAFYAERTSWKVRFNCTGTAGHGSLLLRGTAAEKILYIQQKMAAFRDSQVQLLESNDELNVGDVTTVNLTIIEGGVLSNVVPPMMSLIYDVRLAIDVSLVNFEAQLREWCREAGDVELEFLMKEPFVEPTDTTDANVFWRIFSRVIVDELQLKIRRRVFPGATDSRFVRGSGIPAIGFSPINLTPVLLHDHDELLGVETYLKGIRIYSRLVEELGNAN